MRQLLFAIVAIAFVISLCFAQDPVAPMAQSCLQGPDSGRLEVCSFSGKVKSLQVGSAEWGTSSLITVTDERGKNMTFAAGSGTLVTDDEGATYTLGDIKNDSRIVVKYAIGVDGANNAQAIILTQ